MGIHREMAKFLLQVAKDRPIAGAVILIGRQTVHLTPTEFQDLLFRKGVQYRSRRDLSDLVDTTTRAGMGQGFISDTAFFEALGADSVVAMDVTDYEGAEVIHNLDTPLPSGLVGQFDFVFNGSVLDNVFDPATAIRNISRLVREGGRVVHFEHASNAVNNAYLQFSPNWFYDYYIINQWLDCWTYLCEFDSLDGRWDWYACVHRDGNEPGEWRSSRALITAAIATRGEASSCERTPIQGQYRSPEARADFERASRGATVTSDGLLEHSPTERHVVEMVTRRSGTVLARTKRRWGQRMVRRSARRASGSSRPVDPGYVRVWL